MTMTPLDLPVATVGTPQAFYHRHNTTPRFPLPHRAPAPGPDHDLALRTALRRSHQATVEPGGSADPLPELFVDLTSPWAYLAHLRLDRAPVRPGPQPPWRVVQPDTRRPEAGLRGPGPEADRVREELEAVRAVALDTEELPHDIPSVLPHPRAVAAAYAEGVDLGRGPQVRAALLHAYWVEGRDIGDPEVLRRVLPAVLVDDRHVCDGDPRREFGYVVSPAREPLTDAAYHLLLRWQRRWDELGRPGPVALVGPDGVRTCADALPVPAPGPVRPPTPVAA